MERLKSDLPPQLRFKWDEEAYRKRAGERKVLVSGVRKPGRMGVVPTWKVFPSEGRICGENL